MADQYRDGLNGRFNAQAGLVALIRDRLAQPGAGIEWSQWAESLLATLEKQP